jgi:PEP-CTERM motif
MRIETSAKYAVAVSMLVGGLSLCARANLILNPKFDYTGNGDGAAPNNVNGVVDPQGYTVSSGPSVTFNGPAPSYPGDGTANFPSWAASSTTVAAQNLPQSLFNTPKEETSFGGVNPGQSLIETVFGALAPNTSYLLTVDVYSRNDVQTFTSVAPVIVELEDASNNILAGVNGTTNVGSGTSSESTFTNGFGTITINYTSGPAASGNLKVFLAENSSVSNQAQPNFANASLLVVVPEPASISLIGLCALGLLARRRHLS